MNSRGTRPPPSPMSRRSIFSWSTGRPGARADSRATPAVPALRDKLRPGATVMLDDCHRRDEKETLRRWLAEVFGVSLVRRIDHLAVMKIS